MKTLALALVIVLLAFPAKSQPAPPLQKPVGSTETLPLGLDKFYWRMTSAEAAAQYKVLGPMTKPLDDQTMSNERSEVLNSYRWKDCTFEVHFSYANIDSKEQLADVFFLAFPASSLCSQQIRKDLASRYGESEEEGPRGMVWATPQSRYAKEHEAELYSGMSAMERFNASANAPKPKARYIWGADWGRVFLFGEGMPGHIIYDAVSPRGFGQ